MHRAICTDASIPRMRPLTSIYFIVRICGRGNPLLSLGRLSRTRIAIVLDG